MGIPLERVACADCATERGFASQLGIVVAGDVCVGDSVRKSQPTEWVGTSGTLLSRLGAECSHGRVRCVLLRRMFVLLPDAACLGVALQLSICASALRCMSLLKTCGLLPDAAYTEVALWRRRGCVSQHSAVCLSDGRGS